MGPRELTRRDSKRVVIAHISDLHFTAETRFPELQSPEKRNAPEEKNAPMTGGETHLRTLVADIAEQKPDLLAVTGDIADNPFAERLRELFALTRTENSEAAIWSDSLGATFKRAKRFFEDICLSCNINPLALFVIPGNHDCRLQGTYSGGWLGQKRYYAKAAAEAFSTTFATYWSKQDSTIFFSDPGNGTPIVLRIACLDSNDSDAYLNFATGGVSQIDLESIDRLKVANGAPKEATLFRICLVHHHPLPVVTAEVVRDDKTQRSFVDRVKNLVTTLTGEQTNIFKNGGTFLFKCLNNEVDLVIHGHQHRPWFSNIQYPARSNKRLLVAAAPSAGVKVDGSYGYCLYKLDNAGNIEVCERKISTAPVDVSPATHFFVYENDELRRSRRRNLVERLEDQVISDLGSRYGVATADKVTREVQIYEDGNTRMTYTYEGLVPRGSDTLELLPMRTVAPGAFFGLVSPAIKILHDRDNYYQQPEWKTLKREKGIVGNILFTPELHFEHPISLQIEFLLCNTVQFVQEYQRATSKNSIGHEYHSAVSRSVYPTVARDVVTFPLKLTPKGSPRPHVSRNDEPPDILETEHASHTLNYSPERGIISLLVREPLPDYRYQVSWDLLPEVEFNSMFYTDAGVERFRLLAQPAPPTDELKTALVSALTAFRDRLTRAKTPSVLDNQTEVSLHIAVVKQSDDFRCKKVQLHRFAGLNSGGSGLNSFVPGEGIAGQAFRSRQPLFFRKGTQQGCQFYVVRESEKIHSLLYCIPLPVIPQQRARVPVYGVLSVGSYADQSTLDDLGKDAIGAFFTDLVMGMLNQQIQRILDT